MEKADPSAHGPPADLTTPNHEGHTVVELRGDLGGTGTATLRERLLRTLHHSTSLVVLDLSAVSHCDAQALAVLVNTQRRARLLGVTLRLAAPRPDLMRLLRLTDLDRSLTTYPTLAQALVAP